MKKTVHLSLTGCLLVFIISCTTSQFSSTERSYKNGHAVYKNKHQKEVRLDHARKVNNHKQKEEISALADDSRVNSTRSMGPTDKEVILASSSDDLLIINIDPVTINNALPEPDRKNRIEKPDELIVANTTGNQSSINPDTIVKKQDTSNYARETVNQPNQPPRKIEGLGVAGTITGIVGLFIAGIPLGIVSLIFGFVCIAKVKRNPKKRMGKGFGIAAIILGVVDIVGAMIVLSMMN
jgi:hypothetical protein